MLVHWVQYRDDTNSMDGWENAAELVLIALLLIVQTTGNCVLIFNFTDFRWRRAGETASLMPIVRYFLAIMTSCIHIFPFVCLGASNGYRIAEEKIC